MTDEVFMARLHGYCYGTQASGYVDTPPNFRPIIPYMKRADETIDREGTLGMTAYCRIVGVERTALLRRESSDAA